MAVRAGSGFQSSRVRQSGYVFCARIGEHDTPWFRYVAVDNTDWTPLFRKDPASGEMVQVTEGGYDGMLNLSQSGGNKLYFLRPDRQGQPKAMPCLEPLARERGYTVDIEGYERAMDVQRKQSQAASHFGVDLSAGPRIEGTTEFRGYEGVTDEATLRARGERENLRKILVEALDTLHDAEPRPVAVDVILAGQAADPADDARLEAAFRSTPNLILGCLVASDGTWENPLPRFAELAAPFFDTAEIIELHHDRKVDSPSGTALATARLMREARGSDFRYRTSDLEHIPGARGAVEREVDLPVVRDLESGRLVRVDDPDRSFVAVPGLEDPGGHQAVEAEGAVGQQRLRESQRGDLDHDALRAHVHEHKVVLRAAADEPELVPLHPLGQRGLLDHGPHDRLRAAIEQPVHRKLHALSRDLRLGRHDLHPGRLARLRGRGGGDLRRGRLHGLRGSGASAIRRRDSLRARTCRDQGQHQAVRRHHVDRLHLVHCGGQRQRRLCTYRRRGQHQHSVPRRSIWQPATGVLHELRRN